MIQRTTYGTIPVAASLSLAACASQTTTETMYFAEVETERCRTFDRDSAAFDKKIGAGDFSFDKSSGLLCVFDRQGEIMSAYRASACASAQYELITETSATIIGEKLTFRPTASDCALANTTPEQVSEPT